MNRAIVSVFVTAVLTGCAARANRPIPIPASTGLQSSYIDLQPGWRLRVITPLTASGSYRPTLASKRGADGTVTFALGDDFLGYETSFYSVTARARGGVRIKFISAEDTKNGVTAAAASPRARLFDLSRHVAYVRLVYLARVSRSDHDMAVIAAHRPELLNQATIEIEANPQSCRTTDKISCTWIPAGIAVRPERRRTDGGDSWLPAR